MNDTSTRRQKDPFDTSTEGMLVATPIPVPEPYFNRECRRYAKKHKLSLEEAFDKLYR